MRSVHPKHSTKLHVLKYIRYIFFEFGEFLVFLQSYATSKSLLFSGIFENRKNNLVRAILIKRGKRNRMFLHVSAMTVLTLGVLLSPILNESNPFSSKKNTLSFAQTASESNYLVSENVFNTQRSEKPRDKIISYTVEKGDTVSSIAQKFNITADTIRWENDLKNDSITAGDTLRILPVSGIAHKVESGDNIYSIAKKYSTDPQPIVDYPFNDFADPKTFSLVVGEILIVPDGVKPEEKAVYRAPRYFAKAPAGTVSGGFAWPVHGTMNQYFSWFHPGIDLGVGVGTPVVAAQSGEIVGAYSSGWNGGYGVHIIVKGDNGFSTLYAHLSSLNVSVGDRVAAGQTTIGWSGNTGRSTGPHLHFEIRGGGGNVNPLSYLQ